jgi:hypothetical protein
VHGETASYGDVWDLAVIAMVWILETVNVRKMFETNHGLAVTSEPASSVEKNNAHAD